MHRLGLVAWMVIACVSCVANAAPGDGRPSQQLLTVQSESEWQLTAQNTKPVWEEITFEYEVKVPYTVTKQVVVNGETQEQQFTEYEVEKRTGIRKIGKLVSEMSWRPLDPQTAKAFETDGRPIELTEVARRCQEPTLVVVSSNDKMIPDYYAAVFQPGTIILALPPLPVCEPMPGPIQALPPVEAPPVPNAPAPPSTFVPSTKTTLQYVSQVQVEPPQPSALPAEPAPGAYQSPLPAAPAPELVFLGREGADLLKIRRYVEREAEIELTVKANDSSIAPEKPMKVLQTVKRSTSTVVPWGAVRISQPSSGDLPKERTKEKLGQGEVTAVLSADGKLIDAFWLQNLKPTVLVIRGVALPAEGGYAMPMPMPMPMPVLQPPQAAPVPVPAESKA